MKFSERVRLAKDYEKWLKEFNESEPDFQLKDCALTVLTFLEEKGFLKNGFTQLNPEGTREHARYRTNNEIEVRQWKANTESEEE